MVLFKIGKKKFKEGIKVNIMNIKGYDFIKVTNIKPFSNKNGEIIKYFPESRYSNVNNLSLHHYGNGPFCRFRIPEDSLKQGVYVIEVNDSIMYVGECAILSERFNKGYGNISPRNCFVGGQPTNCRINHSVYIEASKGKSMGLYFYETSNRVDVERGLIKKLNPPWNKSRGKKNLNANKLVEERRVGGSKIKKKNCREEILASVKNIVENKGINEFTVKEVLMEMKARGTHYKDSTISTHITSKCCVNTNQHHHTVYEDFKKLNNGLYMMLDL